LIHRKRPEGGGLTRARKKERVEGLIRSSGCNRREENLLKIAGKKRGEGAVEIGKQLRLGKAKTIKEKIEGKAACMGIE